jgi:hypothetical protein
MRIGAFARNYPVAQLSARNLARIVEPDAPMSVVDLSATR